ncbi:unnamed protein product [Rotaria sordida]|nr:unnamed protein product [Rotaria sordida]
MTKSVTHYGNLVCGFNKENNPLKILNLFKQMKLDSFEADLIIYPCIIKASSEIGDDSICQSIIKRISDSFFVDNNIQNVLIDMWVKLK